MSKGFTSYKIYDQNALHFLTIATVEWIDVFTGKKYREIITESLVYCQREKGLVIYGWCLMSHHIHLLAKAREGFELSAILRDFKKHTSKQILKTIKEEPESRKAWLLPVMKQAGASNPKNSVYQLWRNDNHPVAMYQSKTILQKLDYIHQNPVKAGIVENPEDYLYSSARNYADKDSLLTIAKI